MKRLLFYIRIYLMSISRYFIVRMQYRADFIISSIGILGYNIAGLVTLWLIFRSIPALKGWSYEQLIFIYGFSILTLTPLQIFFDNLWHLRRHINEGTFIKYYFRPANTLFCYISEMLDVKGISQFIFGVAIFIYSSIQLQVEWTALRIALFPLLWFSSSLIMISLMLMAASVAFWTTNSFAVLGFVFSFKDHARYPVGIYNTFFRYLFTFIIPIGYIAFYPAQFYISDTPPDFTTYLSPVLGIVLFILGVLLWNKGVKSYAGTGS